MMMEQDLFALPKTQMSVDWKYTFFSNLQDIDNLFKKCSFKYYAMVGALFIIYEPYEPYGAKRCTDKTLLGP